jgi:hypothetical protein
LRPDHHKAICSVRLFPSSPPQNDMPSAPISALTLKIAICLLYILPRVSIFPPHSSVAPLHILMRVCVIPPLSSLSDMPCVRLSKDLSHTALTLTQWYALSAHFRQSVSYRPHLTLKVVLMNIVVQYDQYFHLITLILVLIVSIHEYIHHVDKYD